ncbi:KH domain-containing protein HEN4 isoform X3 [Asparagus officinalis]|uniref:KH domain-containing protein HEN4 isoform X3 n=1 Tax=Asparagus officinalis TaxID=4686 RepID=UPI00098E35FF|nr:KH domain-containing protein HEN4 isoform X3 [Asparagus officinalis]
MALVRVFERIEELEEGREASCRLLVSGTQVGCVLGKGGKIVERIRGESGAQIRVLGKEQLPVCAAAGDELIYITGSLSAVRRALLSVSSCLQGNPRTEPTNFSTMRSFGSTPDGSGAPAPVDPYAHRSYVPSHHAPDYHSRTYTSNPGIDVTTHSLRKVHEEDVIFRMLCSKDRVGSIIGKAGIIVRNLQNETGASIRVVDAVSDSDERIIVISAHENSEMKGSIAQDAVLRVHSRLIEGVDKGSLVPARLLVPAQHIGCLLGKGGSIIAEMRRSTGANIRIFSKEQVPNCAQPNDEVVQVIGTVHSVQDALFHITSRIRETIFPQKLYASAGMTHYSDIPPLHRSRNEQTVGLSHGLDTIDRHPPLPHAVDHLAVDRVPFSYSSETTGLRHFDHSPSPRSWGRQILQITSSGNPRGIPDTETGFDFRSGLTGSVPHTPVVTNTSIEVIVPQHLLAFVHGENDSNLILIRELKEANCR